MNISKQLSKLELAIAPINYYIMLNLLWLILSIV
jgi:hypothetical protein